MVNLNQISNDHKQEECHIFYQIDSSRKVLKFRMFLISIILAETIALQ